MTPVKYSSIHFTKLDVTQREDWVRAWNEAEEILGGKIEILCNNAGVPPRVCIFRCKVDCGIQTINCLCRQESV